MYSLIPHLRFRSLALIVALSLLGSHPLTAGVNPPGFPAFPSGQYHPAGLGPKVAKIVINYPNGATNRGIMTGSAVVSVSVDAGGKATDYLIIGCTDQVFGPALVDEAKTLAYQPAKLNGVAVPARYDLGYIFAPESMRVEVSAQDAVRLRSDKDREAKLTYSAVSEKDLDHPLEITNAALPRLPEGFQSADKKETKVFVTFYIDEQGHVRAPNVESAASPELIPRAIEAIRLWSFKPPLVKGAPALVYTGKAMRFMPRDTPNAPLPAAAGERLAK